MNPPAPAAARTTNRTAALVLVCAAVAACEPVKASPSAVHAVHAVHASPRPTTASTETAHDDALGDGRSFQTYRSARFDFSLPLPDSASFNIDDKTDRWFVATHTPTASTLLVRAWREYEIMNRVSCEERARLYRTLPEREGRVAIEERRIDVPPEHDTIVDVRVRERAQTPRFEGTVLAFGGWAHGCFAFVFVTRDNDETTVAARLSTMVHGTLERMKFDSVLVPKRTPPDLKTPLRLDMRESPIR